MKKIKGFILLTLTLMFVLGINCLVFAEDSIGLNYDEVTMFPGQKLQLEILNPNNADVQNVTYSVRYGDITVDEKGVLTANSETWGYVSVEYEIHKDETTYYKYDICYVTVKTPTLSLSTEPLAVGVKRTVDIDQEFTNTTITWSSLKTQYATVGAKTGTVKGIAYGTAKIKATLKSGNSTYQVTSKLYISNPRFASTTDAIAVGGSTQLKIKGLRSQSVVSDYKSSNSQKLYVSSWGYIYGEKKASKVTVSAVVDGKKIKMTFAVTNPTINYSDTPLLVKKGSKVRIKASNTSAYSHMTFKSDNKKVATVSKKGYVKGIKYGSTYVEATVDYKTFYVNVGVSTKKAIKAVKKGYSVLGSPYSQAKRMQSGYYDCSSFVWKSYSPYGIYFGNKTWAPTAADIAKNMANTGKMIYKKGVSYKKLRPGDLIFMHLSSTNNGRYKNIDHVAIYVGNDTIIHANGTEVSEGSYSYNQDWVVGIARPVK
jgi:cell wall-associated NlpC family hydrolase